MIGFIDAINIASKHVENLIKNAKNIELEGVMLSNDDSLYEVILSYDLINNNSSNLSNKDNNNRPFGVAELAKLMGQQRECKVFFIDSVKGQFRGFKNYQEG